MSRKLELEINETTTDRTVNIGNVMMTPAIEPNYWLYRVKLSDKQAIVGFPKFTTIGIGFAEEEDWNTNLPCLENTEIIFEHIKDNKGDESISDADCIEAIRMIQKAAREYLVATGTDVEASEARIRAFHAQAAQS